MDPRRIKKTGNAGAAKNNKEAAQRLGNLQSRSSGNIEIPRVSLFRNEAQTIPDSTWTGVDFDFEEYDEWGLHTGAGDDEFVFDEPAAGVWQVNIHTRWDLNTVGSRHVRVMLNGAQEIPQSQMRELASSSTAGGASLLQSNFMITIAEDDVLSVEVAQYSGDPLDLTKATFQAFRLGA
jgi:hypothetical protein